MTENRKIKQFKTVPNAFESTRKVCTKKATLKELRIHFTSIRWLRLLPKIAQNLNFFSSSEYDKAEEFCFQANGNCIMKQKTPRYVCLL